MVITVIIIATVGRASGIRTNRPPTTIKFNTEIRYYIEHNNTRRVVSTTRNEKKKKYKTTILLFSVKKKNIEYNYIV